MDGFSDGTEPNTKLICFSLPVFFVLSLFTTCLTFEECFSTMSSNDDIKKDLEGSGVLAEEEVNSTDGDELLMKNEDGVEGDEEPSTEKEEGLPVINKMMKLLGLLLKYGGALLIVVYLIAAFVIDFQRAIALFVITVNVVVYHIYWFYTQRNEELVDRAEDSLIAFLKRTDTEPKASMMFAGTLILIMIIMMAVTVRDARNLISLFGMIVFMLLTWLFSYKPDKVQLRPVIGSTFMQFVFGYIVIRTSWGLAAMEFLPEMFTTMLGYTLAVVAKYYYYHYVLEEEENCHSSVLYDKS